MTGASVHIVGVGSQYAWDVAETVARLGDVPVCVDNLGNAEGGLPNLTLEASVSNRTVPFVLGGGSAIGRFAIAERAQTAGWSTPVTLIDPTSTAASTVTWGHGAYVNAGVVIGSHASIGCFANINRSASVGHHTVIGISSHVGPGATLAGGITVGDGVFIGAGAVVLPHMTIGDGAVVGAGSVVTKNVEAGKVVVGSPAQYLRNTLEKVGPCPYCATL